MNIGKGVAIGVVGVVIGSNLTDGSNFFQRLMQGQDSNSQTVVSPVAQEPVRNDRLETKNFVFEHVKVDRYTGEVSANADVAGELYQVTAKITNRSSQTLAPSGLNGVSYKLQDDQGRKYEEAEFGIGLMSDGLKSTNGILPGQTREIMVGVFDVLPGANNLELGVSDGMFADMKFVMPSQAQQATASPVASPIVSSSTTLISAPPSVSFESLPPCEQLDSIARSGKSVAEFLVASARVNDLAKYQTAIASVCPWNAEQLQVADRVLNPPVIVAAPVVTVSSGSSNGGSSGRSSGGGLQPAPAWNNCNGVQEPGESYSARCETAQEMNDAGIGNRWSQDVDNRPPWRSDPGSIDPGFGRPPGGREGPANGYSAN